MSEPVTGTLGPWEFWLLPMSWLLHDLEEILTIERWSRAQRAAIPARVDDAEERRRLPSIRRRLVASMASTRRRFTIAVVLVGCVVVGATVGGVLDTDGWGLRFYVTILGGYFLHAFVHLGQSIVFRGYTPGVVTAVTVVVPASGYLYWWLRSTGHADVRLAVLSGVLGLLLFVPIVLGANTLAAGIDRTIRRR